MDATTKVQDCQSQESHSFRVTALSAIDAAEAAFGKPLTMYGYGELIVRVLVPRGRSEASCVEWQEHQELVAAGKGHLCQMWQRENMELHTRILSKPKRFKKSAWRRSVN